MAVLEQLEPKGVFYFFEEISKIPRGTYDMKRISDYCVSFAKERGLVVIQDEAYNVIIKKPGTKGYEDSEPVILQGHLDMVCVKTSDSNHDFKKDALDLYVEDGFVKARGTTLGGDNGIAIAYAMALIDSDDIPHPPIEAVFTADEEEGLVGAAKLDVSVLDGQMLINLDSSEEHMILAGCAGGFRQELKLPVRRVQKKDESSRMELKIDGLRGGHSGGDIHEQRGNANKLIGRLLTVLHAKTSCLLVEVNGGSKDNVITTSAMAAVVVDREHQEAALSIVSEMAETWKREYGATEPELTLSAQTVSNDRLDPMGAECTERAIFLINCTPYGVQEFSRELEGIVETSLNLGVVTTDQDYVSAAFMVRSSAESKLEEMQYTLTAWANHLKAETTVSSSYPAWMYKVDSELRQIMIETHKEVFGKEPIVTTIHAGLECGILSGKNPDLDCVSIGPNMYDLHSVDERMNIESVERVWNYLKAVLANCK